MPLVTVVMPGFNAAPYVEQAVRSALDQTCRDVELIFVDDGSTDGTATLVKALQRDYGDRLTLLQTERAGPYPARNRALAQARGDFITFLDADDYWRPDFLARMHAALTAGGADLAYCGWQNFGEGTPGSDPYLPPEYEKGDPVEAFLRACPWPIHAALVRRPIIDTVGAFSEQRFSSMDYDLWLRVLGVTRNIVRVPEVMAFYRWHGRGQVSSVKWRQVLDALAAQKSFIAGHRDLVEHLPRERLDDLTEGQVRRQAYRAVWNRDLASAQRLFRHVILARSFGARDLRHVAAAMLPMPLYRRLVARMDSNIA